MPKFPDIEVQLTGESGNAFAVLGQVKKAMEQGGVSDEDVEEFMREATAGDYDHLLQTVMKTVEVL